MHLAFNIRATSILYSFILQNKGKGLWIIPVNCCHLIPACFIKANCPFEFVDVEKNSLCINENEVINRLTKTPLKYSGILIVRNYGEDKMQNSLFNRIRKSAPHIKIIDDACLSYPNFNIEIPDIVDLELYSTGYSKPLDIGYGGFAKIHTKDRLLSEINLDFDENALIEMNKYYTKSCNSLSPVGDLAFKRDWLNFKVIKKDKYVEEVNTSLTKAISQKNKLNKIYDELILSKFKEKRLSSNWRYNIRCNNPNYVLEKINEQGLFASQHYFPLNKVFGRGLCPIWEKTYSTILNLFNDHRFNDEKAMKCCKIINQFAKPIVN